MVVVAAGVGGISNMMAMQQMNGTVETGMWWDVVIKVAPIVISIIGGVFGFWTFSKQKSYEARLNKELQTHKHSLDKKQYISKVRFDAEFEIYRELLAAFWDMVYAAMDLFPKEIYSEKDRERQNDIERTQDKKAAETKDKALEKLNRHSAFINEDLYKNFSELQDLCGYQIQTFRLYVVSLHRFGTNEKTRSDEKNKFAMQTRYNERFNKTDKILSAMQELTSELRTYLSKLDVTPQGDAASD
jgi:phosphate/sulfate permease